MEGKESAVNESPAQPDEGRLLTATELAALMNVSKSYLEHKGKTLPFAVRLPGSRKVHGYSYTGYLRWKERQAG